MAQLCPYCRTEVRTEEEPSKICEGCNTPHHAECYEENGGCTLFGCKFAPADDPKVEVTSGDVSHYGQFGTAAAVAYAPTGFGDVEAPLVLPAATSAVPPPPPPPTGGSAVSAPPAPFVPPVTSASTYGSTLFTESVVPEREPKSRLVFILLGVFLGSFGAHNFYAGYTKRGIAQLCLTVCTLFYGSIVTWIWAIVDVCTVNRDHDNNSFA